MNWIIPFFTIYPIRTLFLYEFQITRNRVSMAIAKKCQILAMARTKHRRLKLNWNKAIWSPHIYMHRSQAFATSRRKTCVVPNYYFSLIFFSRPSKRKLKAYFVRESWKTIATTAYNSRFHTNRESNNASITNKKPTFERQMQCRKKVSDFFSSVVSYKTCRCNIKNRVIRILHFYGTKKNFFFFFAYRRWFSTLAEREKVEQ